jgi:uncharacterized sporulation protein YeaH/YhbH (DUF444 family)
VEVSLEELAEYLFNDLELPDLEKKQFRFVSQETIKRKGYRFKGIRPRLSKKETLKRKIRRQKMAEKAGTYDPEGDERFPFTKMTSNITTSSQSQRKQLCGHLFSDGCLRFDVSGPQISCKKLLFPLISVFEP